MTTINANAASDIHRDILSAGNGLQLQRATWRPGERRWAVNPVVESLKVSTSSPSTETSIPGNQSTLHIRVPPRAVATSISRATWPHSTTRTMADGSCNTTAGRWRIRLSREEGLPLNSSNMKGCMLLGRRHSSTRF